MSYFSVRDVVTAESTEAEMRQIAASEAHHKMQLVVTVQVRHPENYYARGEDQTISLNGPREVIESAAIEKGVGLTIKAMLDDSEKRIAKALLAEMVEYRDKLSAAKAEDDAANEAAGL